MDETQPPITESEPEPDPVAAPPAEQTQPSEPAKARNWTTPLLSLIVVLLVVVIGLQFVQMQRSRDLQRQVVGLESDVTDLKPLRGDIDLISEQLSALDDQVATAVASSSPAAVTAETLSGNLPQFEGTSNDVAVLAQMEMPEISGPEYYSGEQVTYTAGSDGKAHVWLVWAHWCPHCQAELPDLNAWWPENAARYPDIDLATVTTAIDDSRGNPLEQYLDTQQFSFPVIVDESGQVAAKFGTNAFPFWVLTDTDGKVVFRIAGELGIDNVEQIFTQLETLATES
jgi:thiol-disulfide isomerase/thioredoxin